MQTKHRIAGFYFRRQLAEVRAMPGELAKSMATGLLALKTSRDATLQKRRWRVDMDAQTVEYVDEEPENMELFSWNQLKKLARGETTVEAEVVKNAMAYEKKLRKAASKRR